jgi:hypothetical protein
MLERAAPDEMAQTDPALLNRERQMDYELEKAIDDVGREKVFQLAREYGWGNDQAPPSCVWWGIVNDLRAAVPA